jgi:trimeric autotransporter adhesin
MKTFIVLLLLILSACSKISKTELQISTSYVVNGATGGAVLYLNNLDTKVNKSVVLENNSIRLSLEPGNWEFIALVWDGTSRLAGNLKCARKTAQLMGPSVVLDIAPSVAQCDQDFFSGPTFRTNGETKALGLVNCKSLAGLDGTSTCDSLARGGAESYKIKLLVQPGGVLESNCLPGTQAPGSVTNTAVKIPAGNPLWGPFIVVETFSDAECFTRISKIKFPWGITSGTSDGASVFPSPTQTQLFIDQGKVFISSGPLDGTTPNSITISNLSSTLISTFNFTLPPGFIFTGGSYPGTGGTCTSSLAANSSCSLSISLSPTETLKVDAPISFTFNDGMTIQTFATNLRTTVTPASLTVSPVALSFGNVIVNDQKTLPVTLTNTGLLPAYSLSFTPSGADPSVVSYVHNCPASLSPGSSCVVNVKFSPKEEFNYTTPIITLNYLNGRGASPIESTIPISGMGRELAVPNGPVEAMLVAGTTLYLGGSFSALGKNSGGGLKIKNVACGTTATCVHDNYPSLSKVPKVNGIVRASIPDGNGGYYIGGSFSYVGSVKSQNIAHILSDGSVDPVFAQNLLFQTIAPAQSAMINALALSGNSLFVGGDFVFSPVTGSATDSRNHLVRLNLGQDPTNLNHVTTDLNPDFLLDSGNPDGPVHALAISAGTLFLGGSFSSFGGSQRNRAAAVDIGTNTLTTWAPNFDGTVKAIASDGISVYAGGNFIKVNSLHLPYLAKIDASGTPVDWQLGPNGAINAITIQGDAIYVGGEFSQFITRSTAGGPIILFPRSKLASFDLQTGLITNFDSAVNGTVHALAHDGTNLHVGGEFSTIMGVARNNFASINTISTTPAINAISPEPNAAVLSIAASTNSLFMGGSFSGINMKKSHGLAALDLTTGELVTGFLPNIEGTSITVKAMHLQESTSTLYIGGLFSGGTNFPRQNLAALDATTGSLITNFQADTDREVQTRTYLTLPNNGPDRLVAGGVFSNIKGTPINSLAFLDPTNGILDDLQFLTFNPGGEVKTLSFDGVNLYAGGIFTQPFPSLVKINLNLNSVDQVSNMIGSSDSIKKILVDGNDLIFGGNIALQDQLFRMPINIQNYILAGPLTDILLNGADTLVSNFVSSPQKGILITNKTSGISANHSLDKISGSASLAVYNNLLILGGDFRSVNNQARGNLAVLPLP